MSTHSHRPAESATFIIAAANREPLLRQELLLVKLLWQNLLIAKVLGVIAGHIPGAASYTYTM